MGVHGSEFFPEDCDDGVFTDCDTIFADSSSPAARTVGTSIVLDRRRIIFSFSLLLRNSSLWFRCHKLGCDEATATSHWTPLNPIHELVWRCRSGRNRAREQCNSRAWLPKTQLVYIPKSNNMCTWLFRLCCRIDRWAVFDEPGNYKPLLDNIRTLKWSAIAHLICRIIALYGNITTVTLNHNAIYRFGPCFMHDFVPLYPTVFIYVVL